MATPTLTTHTLRGALGDILVDVRAGGRTSSRPAVVIVHGFKGFKDWGMFPPFAERLARAGITAVTFNASGSGVDGHGRFAFPDRFGHNTFSAEMSDVRRVMDALASGALGTATPSAIGLLGHSRGGGVAVLHAAADARVRALVTWAAISTVRRWSSADEMAWRAAGVTDIVNTRTGERLPLYTDLLDDVTAHADGALDIPAAASRIAVPWLLVHGTGDDVVSVLEGETLQEAGGPGLTPLVLDGAGHTFGAMHPWQGETPEFRRVADATLRCFASSLG